MLHSSFPLYFNTGNRFTHVLIVCVIGNSLLDHLTIISYDYSLYHTCTYHFFGNNNKILLEGNMLTCLYSAQGHGKWIPRFSFLFLESVWVDSHVLFTCLFLHVSSVPSPSFCLSVCLSPTVFRWSIENISMIFF